MKTRETKQNDLNALTESLAASKSAMVVSFTGVTVAKDQEFRNSIREAGARYEVVKNTLARIAVKGTQFEGAAESFKGVTAIAWTENDPVVLSKAISKFMKDNAETYTFKSGVVDGKLVDYAQLQTIASLPSKEELISKLLFVINAQAQRIVTVINAVPRDLAIVIDQIGKQEGRAAGAPAAEAAPADYQPADQPEAPAEQAEETQGGREAEQDPANAEGQQADEAHEESAANAPDDAAEAAQSEPQGAQSPDDKAEEVVGEGAPAEEPKAE
jgi:large subunit ribosomal protein L10